MIALFRQLRDRLRAGADSVLVSIVAHSGSAPRGAGAHMLVGDGGFCVGTVGGGAVEYRSIQLAREHLAAGTSQLQPFRLAPGQVADLGMVCGGNVEVFFQYFEGGREDQIAVAERICDLLEGTWDSWLVTAIDRSGDWRLYPCTREARPGLSDRQAAVLLRGSQAVLREPERTYYASVLKQAGVVRVFGGGHVSQALAPILHHTGFPFTVLEDRAEFADPALFPGADQVLLGSFADIEASFALQPRDYVVIMTRGHQDDFTVLSQVLRKPARYIGMIGSRKKVAATGERLRELGFRDGDLARIHSPIGLAIGAETPAEIGVSIAAQLIQARSAL